MSDLIPFTHDGHTLRAINRDGDPWFIAKDACNTLGLGNVGQALLNLDDDEKGSISISDGTPGNPNKSIISESGLYSLILRSRKPEAHAFKRWVIHEVIPSIRKRGVYATEDMTERMLADPDVMIRALTELKTERARRAQLEAQAQTNAPKVIFADAVSASHTPILIGELAKILRGNGVEIGQNRLFQILRHKGYLINREGTDRNMPTQKAMELGLFTIKETAITHSDGHVSISKTPKVTGKGQVYFVDRFISGVMTSEAA